MIHTTHPCLLNDACFHGLKFIGYWKPSEKAIECEARLATVIVGFKSSNQWLAALKLPWPSDYVDSNWDAQERAIVIRYLKAGRVNYSYDGWSECRLCEEPNGGDELTDGTYNWPDGYAHYVEKHGVKPPQEFIDHVLHKGIQPTDADVTQAICSLHGWVKHYRTNVSGGLFCSICGKEFSGG